MTVYDDDPRRNKHYPIWSEDRKKDKPSKSKDKSKDNSKDKKS